MDHTNSSSSPPQVPESLRNRADVFVHDQAPPLHQPSRRSRWRLPGRLSPRIGVQTSDETNQPSLKQQSASWGTSLAIHLGLLLLIALLVAPADLGREGVHTIQLTLGDLDPHDEHLSIEVAIEPPSPEPQPSSMIPADQDEPEPAPALPTAEPEADKADRPPAEQPTTDEGQAPRPATTSASTNAMVSHKMSPHATDATGKDIATSKTATGSFFGINAEGYDFVYVLDRSTSMGGPRLHRAASELIRSVNSLSKTQNFYVFLFSKRTVLMFDERSPSPKCIPATNQNKARLEKWLSGKRATGNTDPREALYLAFQMKPSAIFMLSDGEFTDEKPTKMVNQLTTSSTIRLVESFARKLHTDVTPIHAIAYEDPKSRSNMERLATLTGGSSRFVRYKPRDSDQLIADARTTLAQSVGSDRSRQLADLSLEFSKPNISRRARNEFAERLSADANQLLMSYRIGDNEATLQSIIERLYQLDRMRLYDVEHQRRCTDLFRELVQEWRVEGTDALIKQLSTASRSLQQTETLSTARSLLSDILFEQAMELEKSGDRFAAYARFRRIASNDSQSEITSECLEKCTEIENDVQQEIQELADKGKIGSAILYAKKGHSIAKEIETKRFWQQTLRELVFATLAKARDAELERDDFEKRLTLQQLHEGLPENEELENFRRQFASLEINAKKMLSRALKMQRRLHPMQRQQEFQRIVQAFPHSMAAVQASRYLPKKPDEW